jgi:serine/threonine-protein kinase
MSSYQTIAVLSSGGMAEVLVAVVRQESGFAKPCIVKRVLPALGRDTTFAALLRAEARIGAALSHANIVQVQGFTKVEGVDSLIMEFVEGVDLEHVLATCARGALKLSAPMAVLITAEVARALAYVHSRGDLVTGRKLQLVHADVTPGNILISFQGEVKLSDFGIASSRLEGGASDLLAYRGKKSYIPAEQERGDDLTPAADIFALGCVLFEMLTSERLLAEAPDRYEHIAPRIAEKLAGEDAELRGIVTRMTAPDAAARYQSAVQLERDLTRFLEERAGGMARSRLGTFVQTTHSKEKKRCYALLKEAMTAPAPAPTAVLSREPPPPAEPSIVGTTRLMTPTSTTGGTETQRGKDLSMAVPKEEVERMRQDFLRRQESAVLSSPAKSMPPVMRRRTQSEVRPASAKAPSALLGMFAVLLVAVAAALFFTIRKSSQAAHPAPVKKEAPHARTP